MASRRGQSFLVVVVVVFLLIDKGRGLKITGSNGRPTSVYRAVGTANDNRNPYIITARPNFGSTKPDWNDNTLMTFSGDGVNFHDIECFQGQPCSHTIEIPDNFKQVSKPWFWQQNYESETSTAPTTTVKRPKLVKKMGHAYRQLSRYDPFLFHGGTAPKRDGNYVERNRSKSLTHFSKYHSVRPSITWRGDRPNPNHITGYHRPVTPMSMVTAATNMRPSVTWKSREHRDRHIINAQKSMWDRRSSVADYDDFLMTSSRPKRHNAYSSPRYFPSTTVKPYNRWRNQQTTKEPAFRRRDGPYFPVKPDKLEGPEDGQAINPLRDPYSGYLVARPAILNTGYTVSEELSSSANWPTNPATTEFSPAVTEAPIRTWTALEVSNKPDWKGSDEALSRNRGGSQTPYGNWESPDINLTRVPFSGALGKDTEALQNLKRLPESMENTHWVQIGRDKERNGEGGTQWVKMGSVKRVVATNVGQDITTLGAPLRLKVS